MDDPAPPPPSPLSTRALAQHRRRERERAFCSDTVQVNHTPTPRSTSEHPRLSLSTSITVPNSPLTSDHTPQPPSPVLKRTLAQRRRRERERALHSHTGQVNLCPTLPSRPTLPTRVVVRRRHRQRERMTALAHEQVSAHLSYYIESQLIVIYYDIIDDIPCCSP